MKPNRRKSSRKGGRVNPATLNRRAAKEAQMWKKSLGKR